MPINVDMNIPEFDDNDLEVLTQVCSKSDETLDER